METIISSLVTSFGLCHGRVRRSKESLVSDLEENLYLSRVEWDRGQPRRGYFWSVSPFGSSRGLASGLVISRPLMDLPLSSHQGLGSHILICALQHF
ncbi:hypothetical protein BHE74_00043099 [Ensete ventricosum]|nr:hypothetical protein BHE74_00043099 [Ensete ventricosum]